MTTSSATIRAGRQDAGPGQSSPTTAASYVGALTGDSRQFFRDCWGQQPRVFRFSDELHDLVGEPELWEAIDSGLLPPPYVRGFKKGMPVTPVDFNARRLIRGSISEYVDPAQVRAGFLDGATLQFNELQHWHSGVEELVAGLRAEFAGAVTARAFLSPPGQEPVIKAHLDGAHVFVLQMTGDKDWVAGRLDESSVSDCKFCDGDDLPAADALRVTLKEGDMLYLPHGSPHYALARREKSIHLSLEIHQPGPQDLADVYIAQFIAGQQFRELAARTDISPTARMARLGSLLGDYLDAADPTEVLDAAARLVRRHMGPDQRRGSDHGPTAAGPRGRPS
jgi:hypothetical protein